MGTRSYIAKQIGDNQFLTIYCQLNGYPEHNGKLLVDYYNTPEKVDELLALGDLYELRECTSPAPDMPHHSHDAQPGVTIAYQRDEGYTDCDAKMMTLEELYEPSEEWIEYAYIFSQQGKWLFFHSGQASLGIHDMQEYMENDMKKSEIFYKAIESGKGLPAEEYKKLEVSQEWLKFLREQYPAGYRVRLSEVRDDPAPIAPGSMGTLDHIDDAGQFHVHWDDGRTLALEIGVDRFRVLPPEVQTVKFYMPLVAEYFGYDDWGDREEYGTDLKGKDLRGYEAEIRKALVDHRMPEEADRGLMHWYDEQDGVNDKVQSVIFDVENRDGQLWGIAECKVIGKLTPEEKEILADYIAGQASDGWGESVEQRDIEVDDGVLNVHLWNSSQNWTIQEEERFSQDFHTQLPDLCWSVRLGEGDLIYIKKGEFGYKRSKSSTKDKAQNRYLADYNNRRRGITRAQEQAMLTGCLHGWDVPMADPVVQEKVLGAKSSLEMKGL